MPWFHFGDSGSPLFNSIGNLIGVLFRSDSGSTAFALKWPFSGDEMRDIFDGNFNHIQKCELFQMHSSELNQHQEMNESQNTLISYRDDYYLLTVLSLPEIVSNNPAIKAMFPVSEYSGSIFKFYCTITKTLGAYVNFFKEDLGWKDLSLIMSVYPAKSNQIKQIYESKQFHSTHFHFDLPCISDPTSYSGIRAQFTGNKSSVLMPTDLQKHVESFSFRHSHKGYMEELTRDATPRNQPIFFRGFNKDNQESFLMARVADEMRGCTSNEIRVAQLGFVAL